MRRSIVIFLTFIAVLVFSADFIAQRFVALGDKQARDHIQMLTSAIVTSLDPAQVALLQGEADEVSQDYYQEIKATLSKVHASNSSFRFVYLMAFKNGEYIFLVDAEPADSEDYSAPGDVYEDFQVSEEFATIFIDGVSFTEGPYIDEWGEWISGNAAILDPETSEVIAILGIDIDAKVWYRSIRPYYWIRYELIATSLVVGLILLLNILRVWRFNSQLSNEIALRVEAESKRKEVFTELEEKEKELSSILRNTPDIIYRLDDNGFITFISDAVEDYGYVASGLLGTSIRDLIHPEDLDSVKYEIVEKRTGPRRTQRLELRLVTASFTSVDTELHSVDLRGTIEVLLSSEGVYSDEEEDGRSFLGTQGTIRDISDRKEALNEVHALRGLLPICANCKKIRDDNGYWQQIESYIGEHSDAEFSHSICKECVVELYPEINLPEQS